MISGNTGTISWAQFYDFATKIRDHSSKIDDGWQLIRLKDEPGGSYLRKTVVDAASCESERVTMETEPQEEHDHVFEPQDDYGATNLPETEAAVTREYHVLYSIAYGVPVMYFNVFQSGGALLGIEGIWESVPSELRGCEKRTMITQNEHPLLGMPFYQLHPCHTADIIKSAPGSGSTNYLVTWLSCVGPAVGLRVPMSYAAVNIPPACSAT